MTVQQQKIITEYLSVQNLNKTAFLQGWVDESEFARVHDRTLQTYAEKLSDEFELLGVESAKLDLLQAETEESWVRDEYGYMGVSNN